MNLFNTKLITATCLAFFFLVPAMGQQLAEYEDESITGVNREPGRATFWYYSNRDNALQSGYYGCDDNMSLNGKWKFHFCEKPADRIVDFYKPEFDVSSWNNIDVPGSWPLQGYDKPLYMNHPHEFNTNNPYPYKVPTDWNPVGAYRRTFEIPANWDGKRIVLHFGAVKSSFYVFVNGHKVGYSQDSKMQAEFDITPYVKPGNENVLAVEVYRFSKGSYLECQDFWRLAGIKRDVWLYATPKLFLQDFFARSTLTNNYRDGLLDLSYTLKNITNKPITAEVNIDLLDETGKNVYNEQKNVTVKKNLSTTLELKSIVKDCKQWNAEIPALYTLLISVKTPEGVTYSSSKIGFRTVEIKNAQLLINGQYVYIKGANRHEHHAKYGHYIPRETMEKDLELIKQFNLNAIRTAHYPSDPYFYELCDKYGVYVVDEANIESHGLGAALQNVIDCNRHVACDPAWKAIHLDRMERTFQRDKNHASVILWSMGNECGDGENFVDGYHMLRKLDPTRYVQFEQAGTLPHTDIYCPMYMKMENMKNYALSRNATKPLIQCEYAHAMGNSLGNFQDYWDLIETYPVLQGGFVWDFVDQGIENTRDGKRFFEYGGGFGLEHIRNDASFCINGLFNPDRKPNPHAYEAKKVYQSIRVKPSAEGGNKYLLVNNYSFTNTGKYTMKWSVMKNGETIESGVMRPEVDPMSTAAITIPYKTIVTPDAEYFMNIEFVTRQPEDLLPDNWTVAYEQFALNNMEYTASENNASGFLKFTENADSVAIAGENGLKVSFSKKNGALCKYVYNGTDIVKSPVMPDFYRVATDNDDWDAENNIWFKTADKITSVDFQVNKQTAKKGLYNSITVTVKYTLRAGDKPQNTIHFENNYTIYPDGKIEVLNKFNPDYYNGEANMSIPRIGQVVQINGGLNRVQWFGRGPWENYADRKTSTPVGKYAMNVGDLTYDYIRPQENGYRTDVRWLELTNAQGVGVRITGAPMFCFNAQYTSQANFFTKEGKRIRYTVDMQKDDDYYLNIDYGQKGVGGDNSWGKPVHVEYQVLLRYYEYGYSLEPVF